MTRLIVSVALCVGLAIVVAHLVTPAAAAEESSAGPTLFLPLVRDLKLDDVRLYVGTYTEDGSRGIYHLSLDLDSGRLSSVGEPTEASNPSFLALHPSGRFLYAVSEDGRGPDREGGAVSAFAIGPDGSLTLLNQQPSGGVGPCHLSVDRGGRHVLVANYGGGSVTVLPIDADGSLRPASDHVQYQGSSVNPQRQEQPHAHLPSVTSRRAARRPGTSPSIPRAATSWRRTRGPTRSPSSGSIRPAACSNPSASPSPCPDPCAC